MILSISATPNPKQYAWYRYSQHKKFSFKAKSGREELELEIEYDSVFGLRFASNKWRLLDADDTSESFVIEEFTAKRLRENSKGWHGKVKNVNIVAGEGGMDVDAKEIKRQKGSKTKVRMNSSMFSRGLYDAKKKTLYLVFKNGAVWEYKNIDKKEIVEFQNAESQGNWYNQNIKGVKEGQRLDSLE